MDCQTATEQLGAFVDEEVPPDVRDQLAAHIEGCEHCRAEVEAQQQLAARLTTPVETSTPPELWDAIASRLDQTQHTRPAGWR